MVQDPASVGQAFKTISMRIRGAKTELEEAGLETDGMVESTAKLREEIMALSGVDIMLDSSTFKSTYQIMEELADKWQDLTDIQQASVTELIAGKRQGNIVSSLMNNFDIAQNALKTSLGSSGSAMAEHDKWMQSLEAKLNQLKSAWQSFAQTFMSSDFLKGALDVLIKIVDVLDKLIDNFGLLGTIGLGAGVTGFVKYFKSFVSDGAKVKKTITDVVDAIDGLTSVMSNAAGTATEMAESTSNMASASTEAAEAATNLASTTTEVTEATTNLTSASTEAVESTSNLASTTTEATEATANLASTATEATEAVANVASASTEAAEAATNLASGGTEIVESMGNVVSTTTEAAEASASFMSSTAKTVGIIGLIVAALGLAYNAYKNYREEQSQARQETIQTSDDFLNAATSFEQAYIKYSGRTNLTVEEEAELESAINGTVDALGDKSSALQDAVNSSNDYVASLERIAQEELKAANRKAQDKLDAAEDELKEATKGWFGVDGSEVDVKIATGVVPDNEEVAKVAEEIGKKYFDTLSTSGSGTTSTVGFELSPDADINEIIDYYNMLLEYQDRLRELELDDTTAFENTSAAIEKMGDAVNTYIDALYDASRLEYEYTQKNGIPKTVDEYLNMRESILKSMDDMSLDTKKTIANTLDSDYGQSFDLSSAEVQARKLIGILDEYGDIEANEMETFLNVKTAVNNNECTVGSYLSALDDVQNMTKDWSDESKEEFNLAFGLDTDKVKEQYDDMYDYLSNNYIKKLDTSGMSIFDKGEYRKNEIEKVKGFLDNLTASELSALVNIRTEIDWENGNLEEALKIIQEEARFLEAMEFTIAIDVETESIEALNTAMAESVSGAGLSSEAIAALKGRYADLASQGYDLSSMFEETSNGIHLNRKAVDELERAYATDKLSETQDNLNILKGRYDELTDEILNCSDASKRADLYSDQQEVAQKINDLATLAAQYEGLTSVYSAWQSAESAGSERDMYESIIEGFETVGDEISRGWMDDGTIKFLELMTGRTDLATLSAKELKQVWKDLDKNIKGTSYSVRDFFTVDEDGNSTSAGVYNFLNAVDEKFGGNEIVKRNDKGNIIGFDFNVAGGDKAIAEALGISEELVQIMQRAADDAGFVVTLDGNYTQLADLKTSAEKSNDALKKLKHDGLESLKDVDLEFDFDANNLEDLNTQLEKARTVLGKFKDENGKIKTDANGNYVEGAKQALEIASYYQATVDKLTEPVYMQLETNQVEDKLKEPLTKMQEFERLVKQKHQLELEGDTKGLEEVEGKMEDIAEYLNKLDKSQKISLGIEDMSVDEIEQALEKGEIEIPATVDIQLDMSEDIKDMKLLMMNQLGYVSDAEVTLKMRYEVDDALVNSLKDPQKEIVVNFLAKSENEEWFNSLSDEQKEIAVNFIASGAEYFDELDGDSKTIAIDFIIANEELFNSLSEGQKEVAIEFITENPEMVNWFNGLSDEQKKVAIELVDNGFDLSVLSEGDRTVAIDYVLENPDAINEYIDDEDKEVNVHINPKLEKFENITSLLNEQGIKDEERQVIVSFLSDTSKYEELETEDQEVIVKFLANTIETDDYTPEEKEAYVKYIADGGSLEGWEPEDKKAVAQYLVDGTLVEGYSPEDLEAKVKYLRDTVDIDNWTPAQKEAFAKFLVDSTDPDNYQMPTNKSAFATYFKNSHDVDIWNPEEKYGDAAYTPYLTSTVLPILTGGVAKYTATVAAKVDGTANIDGTAFANGTVGKAYKQGNWGVKQTETALTGELGPELVVYGSRYWTVGDNGAEFATIPKGSIVFNHKQTEELFKNGKVTSGGGRGHFYANGTAFSQGTAYGSGSGGGIYPEVKSYPVGKKNTSSSSGSSSSSSSGSASEEFEETLDLIEIAIDRIERAIDQLDQKANNVYKSWSSRNSALTSEISKVGDEINLQQKAYERYMQEAASVGLSSDWVSKIQNGEIDIETITDEDLNDKISSYTEWYEKALDCQDAIEELKETEASLYSQRFENVQTQYDAILQGYEHTEAMLNEYISQAEEQGHIVSKKYYANLIANEKQNINTLKQEQADLIKSRDEAVASGKITKNSEEWYNMCNEIDGVTQSIEESTTALIEFDNAMRDIDWSIFDLVQERISGVTEEADFLIELMSNEKLFDDDGNLTSQGLATMGLHAQNYNTHMYAADTYGEEVAKLDKQISQDPYDQELINRRNELLELQRESILAAEDEKNAIRDLVEDGINAELDALSELIDKKNEELESEKDLFEYSKKVKEQTEEIASLEKQMAAYSGDDSEEAKQKIQQISVELETARQDLQETEYDKLIDDTSSMLDTLYNEYELILNTRLDNIDYLLESVIESINAAASTDGNIATALGSEGAIAIAVSNNATSIKDTLTSEANKVGTTLSSAMNNIWSVGEGNAKSVLTMYGEDFRTKSTTIITTLNNIKADIAAMVDDVDKDAQKKTTANKTTTSAKKNPTTTTTASATSKTTTSTNSASNKNALTEDKLTGIAASIWIYGNGSGWGNDPVRSGKLTQKFGLETAKKVQSIINAKGANGELYKFWLNKNKNLDAYKYSAFKSGAKKIDSSQLAWTQEDGAEFIVRPSDGAILTPIAKSDSILTSVASRNIWDMANSPTEFIKDNLNLGVASAPSNSAVNSAITQHFENIVFSMPNVKNYNELLSELQKDPKFDKLVKAMTIDQIAGKSSLAKGKVIR